MDQVDRVSFKRASDWIKEVRSVKGDELPLLLVGSKADLDEEREISF